MGDSTAAQDQAWLESVKADVIVKLTNSHRKKLHGFEHFHHHFVSSDGMKLQTIFEEKFEETLKKWLLVEKKRVFVYCENGRSRYVFLRFCLLVCYVFPVC